MREMSWNTGRSRGDRTNVDGEIGVGDGGLESFPFRGKAALGGNLVDDHGITRLGGEQGGGEAVRAVVARAADEGDAFLPAAAGGRGLMGGAPSPRPSLHPADPRVSPSSCSSIVLMVSNTASPALWIMSYSVQTVIRWRSCVRLP